MGLEGGALAGAWIGGLAAGALGLAGLLALFKWWMQVTTSGGRDTGQPGLVSGPAWSGSNTSLAW